MRSSAAHLSRALRRNTFASSPALRQSTRPNTCASRTQTQQQRALTTTPRRREAEKPNPNAPPNTTSRETILPQTFYDIFPSLGPSAIPPQGTFTIDLAALKREFLRLQGLAHPDRAPAEKKRQAEAASARINEAYKTLANPLLRAQYVLSLRGIDVAEDETAKVDDAELLMEVLETREVIEEAEREEDLLPLREANERRVEGSVGVLEEAFKSDDIELAKTEAVKLRYWINIRESIDGWERGKPVVLAH